MARIVWKEGHVISIETRRGLYTLAQMSKRPFLIFFNIFQDNDVWKEIDLNSVPVLFCKATTKDCINKSNPKKAQNVKPNVVYEIPEKWLHGDSVSRKIVVWKGTNNEREIIWLDTYMHLVKMDIVNHPSDPEGTLVGWLTRLFAIMY